MPEFVNGFVRGGSIHLLTRTPSGVQTTTYPAEYVAFVRHADLPGDLERHLSASQFVSSARREGAFLRLGFRSHAFRDALCQSPKSPLAQHGIATYEGDVDPVRRWLTDHPEATIQRPRRCWLDIETDSRVPAKRAKEGAARVLSWSVIADDPRRVRFDVLKADTDTAEAELLGRFWEAVADLDQVLAWFGDIFDFPVLKLRSKARRVRFDEDRLLFLDHAELFERHNKNSSQSGEEKQSMALQNIAVASGVAGKLDEEGLIPGKAMGAQTWEMWEAGGEWRDRLVRYMVRDTETMRRIEGKNGYVALQSTICEACTLFGDSRSLKPTRQLDAFMLRLGAARGQRFPTRRFFDEDVADQHDQFKGAYVMDPKVRGIGKDIHVVDFSRMYPANILTFNMSAETKKLVPVTGPIPEGCCRTPTTGVGFTTAEPGLLVVALKELLRLRKEWSKKQASLPPGTTDWEDAGRRSVAYKVAANSFYGVVGSPFSRFFDRAIAESVTQTGVWLLKMTIHAAEERGWKVVYADTDSCFVQGPTDEEFTAFAKHCNEVLYPEALKKCGCVENAVEIAYEKKLSRVVFVSAKRYIASYAHYKGKAATSDSKPEIKGIEYKRGDANKLARRLQAQVIDLLVGGLKVVEGAPSDDLSRYHELVSKMRSHVLDDALPLDEVQIAQKMTKDAGDYKNAPPHVRVAKMLAERGEDVQEGARIAYVVTDGSVSPMTVIPAIDYTGQEADRHYIWEDKVFPPTRALLEAAFPDEPWEPWAKTRPPKVRSKKSAEGQLELGQQPTLSPLPKPSESAVGDRSPTVKKPKEFVAVLDQSRLPGRDLTVVRDIVARHPGDRPLVLDLGLEGGRRAKMSTIFTCDGSEALAEELKRFRAAS